MSELTAAGAEPGRYSPYAARWSGNPADLPAVREGRAGVQDEGSQLVAAALARVEAPVGPWLDLCAGPGGKTALLAGLAGPGEPLVAVEVAPHRAALVRQALRAYPAPPPVLVADGTRPAWRPGAFARVLVDAPCTGLGALRRRPESRWRRQPSDVEPLHRLQRSLLATAIDSTAPGGVVGYVTCSPHRRETVDVVEATLAERDDVTVVPADDLLPAGVDRRDHGRLRPAVAAPARHGRDVRGVPAPARLAVVGSSAVRRLRIDLTSRSRCLAWRAASRRAGAAAAAAGPLGAKPVTAPIRSSSTRVGWLAIDPHGVGRRWRPPGRRRRGWPRPRSAGSGRVGRFGPGAGRVDLQEARGGRLEGREVEEDADQGDVLGAGDGDVDVARRP